MSIMVPALRVLAVGAGLAVANVGMAQPRPDSNPNVVVDAPVMKQLCEERGRKQIVGISPVEQGCIERELARLPKLDASTRAVLGVNFDPAAFLKCMTTGSPSYLGCGRHILQRRPAPEYWPSPDTPRPNVPLPDLDKIYRPGMAQKEYFDALCRAYAGEFINRTVENVEGIYQIRPRVESLDYEMEDPYVIEDPYGYSVSEGYNYLSLYVGGTRHPQGPHYAFVEAPNVLGNTRFNVQSPYVRIYNPDLRERARGSATESLRAQYGFTWRDVTGVRERELGIAGGDLIVADLKTGEVLGHRRGFARSPITARTIGGMSWQNSENCPLVKTFAGQQYRDFGLDGYFLRKVLKPRAKDGE